MHQTIETIKVIDSDGSYRIINKSDLTDAHVIWGDGAVKTQAPAQAQAPAKLQQPPQLKPETAKVK